MAGINFEIEIDVKHIPIPDTPQMKKLLKKGLSAHIFKDIDTLERVAQAIIQRGEYTGKIRKYQRYGLYFTELIGYRISPDLTKIPLYYGEIKINEFNQYHVTPRTKPSQ